MRAPAICNPAPTGRSASAVQSCWGFPKDRGLFQWFALVSLILVAGCADQSIVEVPEDASRTIGAESSTGELPVVLPIGTAAPQGPVPQTVRGIFSEIAERIPGGFGGVYYDEDGRLTIVLQDPGQAEAARAAFSEEAVIRERFEDRPGVEGQLADLRTVEGNWAYNTLYAWYRELMEELDLTPISSSIRVKENRIRIGVRNDHQLQEVRSAAGRIGIPGEAVHAHEATPVFVSGHSLRDKHRPVPGGVQIITDAGVGECTIGPNVIRTTDPPQDGFLLNSHCTKEEGSINWDNITHVWQHTIGWPVSSNHIGNEAIDPPAFSCPQNPVYGCRYTDAALGLYNDAAGPEVGKIARPSGRNTGTYLIDSGNPRFTITDTYPDWSVETEVLEKVGRSTGWTGGVVIDACEAITPIHPDTGIVDGFTRLCSVRVAADGGLGDSGSPMFHIASGGVLELRGMMWGISGNQCHDQSGFLQCENFLASGLDWIRWELDPHDLFVFTPGAGPGPGDPGDCEPDPGEIIPSCPEG